MRDFSFIGLVNGAPDLYECSTEILRREFAKPWRPKAAGSSDWFREFAEGGEGRGGILQPPMHKDGC